MKTNFRSPTAALPSTAILITALCASFTTTASAQQVLTPRPAAQVRDGGTLHLATGTWTRRSSQALATIGADVLYDNSCASGYFNALSADTYVDEGRLPSPTSPSPSGCATSYRVDGFAFGYCTDQPPSTFGTYTHSFFQNYNACTPIAGITPTATIVLSNLPAAPSVGVNVCWNITIDLTGSGAGTFVMAADADGSFGGPSDQFGWAMSSTAQGFSTGPMLAGNPMVCGVGAGTVFSGTPGPGTGLGNMDTFYIDGGATVDGCYFFGGPPNPFAGFDLRLFGTACPSFPPQTNFCFGDGSGTACPCGNNSSVGAEAGCLNSFSGAATLRTYGVASLSNDSLSLLGANMPNGTCLYFQGTSQENGGSGSVLGDGLRCATGTLVRLGTKNNGVGASQFPQPGDMPISTVGSVAMPGTRTYQIQYRNNATFCTPSGFNQTNGVEVTWVP